MTENYFLMILHKKSKSDKKLRKFHVEKQTHSNTLTHRPFSSESRFLLLLNVLGFLININSLMFKIFYFWKRFYELERRI